MGSKGKTAGELLEQARHTAELSQQDVARALGVSRSAVHQWEGDKNQPAVHRLAGLFNILGLDDDARDELVAAFGCEHG